MPFDWLSDGPCQSRATFNADGIYLAVYAALLLNFELSKRGFYASATGVITQTEVRRLYFHIHSILYFVVFLLSYLFFSFSMVFFNIPLLCVSHLFLSIDIDAHLRM